MEIKVIDQTYLQQMTVTLLKELTKTKSSNKEGGFKIHVLIS